MQKCFSNRNLVNKEQFYHSLQNLKLYFKTLKFLLNADKQMKLAMHERCNQYQSLRYHQDTYLDHYLSLHLVRIDKSIDVGEQHEIFYSLVCGTLANWHRNISRKCYFNSSIFQAVLAMFLRKQTSIWYRYLIIIETKEIGGDMNQ